jgi:hypothetical protein
VTENELCTRGFPGGDHELIARYRELIGTTPLFAPELDPEYRRDFMFELVMASALPPPAARGRRRRAYLAEQRQHR